MIGENTVRLYTRQNDKTLSELERNGRIINRSTYVRMHYGDIAAHYMESYAWFTRVASSIVPKPDDVDASIWCTTSHEYCLRPIEGTVVYILDVPESQIIYFDEGKWDYVLNRIYIPENEEDRVSYQQHLKDIGLNNSWDIFSPRYAGAFPEEEQRIRDSWMRIFTIDEWHIFNVCGNIWEIRAEWIHKIVHPGEEVLP